MRCFLDLEGEFSIFGPLASLMFCLSSLHLFNFVYIFEANPAVVGGMTLSGGKYRTSWTFLFCRAFQLGGLGAALFGRGRIGLWVR